MVSQTLLVKAPRRHLFPMFYLGELFCSIKDFHLLVIFSSALLLLVTCKQCTVQNQLAVVASAASGDNFNSSFSDAFDANVGSELVSKQSIEQRSLENICPLPNLFCFASTLTGILGDASVVQSESFSSGLKQRRSNVSGSPHQAIFKLLSGKSISFSFSIQDGVPEVLYPESNQKKDVSSCRSPLVSKNLHISRSVEKTDGGLSTPPVEIKPTLLDWGHQNIFHPSLAVITLKNIHADSVLSVYDLYSSSPQFYPCNFSEIFLARGEVASMCFVFYPLHLGSSQAQLVLQTSFGGFLIQAKGHAVESPYLVKPLNDLDLEFSSGGRLRQNLSLFNPFDESLYVDEIIAWISIFIGNSSRSSKSIFRIHNLEDSGDYSVLSAKDWLAVETGHGRTLIAIRPHNNWEVDPQKTMAVMEFDVSDNLQGKIVAAFCLKLLRSSTEEPDTVMIPFEADLSRNTVSGTGHVSVSLESLVLCNASGLIAIALSIQNNAPYLLRFIKVTEVGEAAENFQIKSVEGLALFPNTSTRVAILSYDRVRTREVSANCKLVVLINETRNSLVEIPCSDVISIFPGRHLASSVGKTEGANNVDYIIGGERIFSGSMQPSSGIKAVDAREADELVLQNWKSHATATFISILYETELLFPMVLVGNYSSQWISVKNPSEEPVAMQIILNSGEVIDKCEVVEELLQPSSSKILAGKKSIAPTSYGFSIAKDAVTEALIHPYGTASLGPILFQPSNRCEWRSSVIIRNNLSGVEWLSLRGFGGSISLALLEDSDPVQSLEFKLNSSTWLNFSSTDTLQAGGGKSHSCHEPLTKEVYAKNVGDLPLEVVKLEVSGAECRLDGFSVHDCGGFSLQPGESTKLRLSYLSDFSAATIYRDLELVLASGVVVIPMKASIPLCFLTFCKRSIFWVRFKKAMVVILFAASFLGFLMFTNVPVFTSQDLKVGKNSYSVIRSLNSLYARLNPKNNAVDVLLKSDDAQDDEALLLESAGACSEDASSEPKHSTQTTSSVDIEPEGNPVLATLSKPSSAENFEMPNTPDSRNLRIRVGKEKGRRRRKKKNPGVGVLPFDVSSSHSSNSTPSSPLSPATSILTPKQPPPLVPSAVADQPLALKNRNPFSEAPLQKIGKTKCSRSSPEKTVQDKEVCSGRCKNVEEPPSSTRTVPVRHVLSPSATFPISSRSSPPWGFHSPLRSASTSAIDVHARAPGSRLHNRRARVVEEAEENMGSSADKYTYDIWGDHLFGHQLNVLLGMSSDSDSFFVRGPQALMKNAANSDLEGGNE